MKKNVYNLFPALLKNRIWGIATLPLSGLYGAAAFLKNFLYDSNIIKPTQVPGKIISIGNISVGGTGKTPLVNTLVSMLIKNGYRTAVVSRGYGGTGKGTICVSDGKNIFSNSEESGDESLLLAKNLAGTPVVVGVDRISAAQYARKKFKTEVIILDDGFQHRKIYRDIDIITINASNPWGNKMLLPSGPLRESLKSLHRGDVFIITHSDKSKYIVEIKSCISKFSQNPIFLTCHSPVSFYTFDHKKISLPNLKNQPVLAFSGIGNPDSFRNTLKDIGCNIKEFIPFPDHYYYTNSDKKDIMERALYKKVKVIITTEKDMVRINSWKKNSIPLYYLKIELKFISKFDKFKQIIKHKVNQS